MDNASWEKVVKDAKEQNKLIFVDCYTTWCGPCKRLAAEVFPREDLGTYVNERFVSVKYDVERGNGLEFAKQYRDLIHGFPTLLLIDTEGKVLNRIVGFFPAETILKAIQNSVEGRTWQVMEQEYQAGKRDRDFVMEYLEALLTADEGEKYDKVKREYIAQFPLDSLMNKEIWELASGYITNPESDEFQFVLAHLNDFANRGFDRYDLEWTLAIQTYYVISDIVSKGFKISSQDTIKQMQERLQFLDTMLQAKVKNFPEYDKITTVRQAALPSGDPLPLSLVRETAREYEPRTVQVDRDAARELLEEELLEPVVKAAPPSGSYALAPGVLYDFTQADAGALTFTFEAPAAGKAAAYHVMFKSGSTAATVNLPDGVRTPDGYVIEAGRVYELSILQNMLAYMSWGAD